MDSAGNVIKCEPPGPDGCPENYVLIDGLCVEPPGPPRQNPDLGWRMGICNYTIVWGALEKGEFDMRVDNCVLVPVEQDNICRDTPIPVEVGRAPYGPQTYGLHAVMWDGPYDPNNLDLSLMQGYISKPITGTGAKTIKTCVLDNVSMCEGILWQERCVKPKGENEEVWEVSMILMCIKEVDTNIGFSPFLNEHCAPPRPSHSIIDWEHTAFSKPMSYKGFRLG